jgi:capsular polysaccharide transport system permease protein
MPMSASQSDVRPSLADYWRGLKVQARVLNALMIRELMMRYGRGNIGFLWLIVEPMLLCAGVVGLRWMIQGHQEHGVPLVALLLSGLHAADPVAAPHEQRDLPAQA